MRTISFFHILPAAAALVVSGLLTCHPTNAQEDVRVDIYECGLYKAAR